MDQFARGPAAQLDEIALRLEAAFNASDAVALASLYSDTAVLMPPNEPMMSGRAAIQAWFQRALSRVRSVRIVPIESVAAGDQAFQAGTFTTTVRTDTTSSPAEQSAAQAGKYILVLKHHAGHWKIQYDIWSLDRPIG